jgi:hypothetical protein
MQFGSAIRHCIAAKSSRPRQWLARRGLRITPSQWQLERFRNHHAGQRAFVIGNGTSLTTEDLDLLTGEVTFGSNKVYLAFDQTEWRPTYYHVSDVLVAENNRDRINELRLTKLFARCVYGTFADRRDIIWLDELPQPPTGSPPGFSTDCTLGVNGGFSVVYHQLQVAFHMGIREVYLIGVDFSFTLPENDAGETAHGRSLISNGEVNHFHPEYRQPGESWTEPRLDEQIRAFAVARKVFERAGGRLVNASRYTKLTALPRAELEAVLAGSAHAVA